MIRPKGFDDKKHWLMIKNAFIQDAIHSKPKYKVIKEADYENENKVLQPKVDGAHSIFALNSTGSNDIYSYRNRKKTGEPIEHTDQVPHLRDLDIPKSLSGTVLRGELYGRSGKKPMPAEQVGGILNSGVDKSLEKQRKYGPLLPYIFDIVKFKGQDVSDAPYSVKYDMLKTVESAVPDLKVADTAFTAAQKRKLVTSIREGRHPDTKEGVVEWDLNKATGSPAKLKFRDTHEVFVRGVFPAVDKAGNEKSEAGGFSFSWTPKGKVVGTVGTGFSREKRIDMLKHLENYIGDVARVKSSKKYESGALRAPSFYSMHVERNLTKEGQVNLKEIRHAAFIDELKKIATVEDPYENNGAPLETFEPSDTNQASTGTSDSYYNPEQEYSSFKVPQAFRPKNPWVNNMNSEEDVSNEY
jgi:hypothetical protein